MKQKVLLIFLSLVCGVLGAAGLAACDSVVNVTSVTLDKTELTLNVGETARLTATVLPENATNKTVYLSVEDSEIVTVNEDGLLVALSQGTTTVTATANAAHAYCVVTVKQPAKSVNIGNVDKKWLFAGEELSLVASVYPEDATSEVQWSVEPAGVASVSGGKVTALSQGIATVTATADGQSDFIEITVTEDGLCYALNEDGQSCYVSGVYTYDFKDMQIASEFAGKPVTSVSKYAFHSHKELESLALSASVTAFDTYALYYCNALESITVDGDNPVYTSVGGILYNHDVTECVWVPRGVKGVVTIPETFTSVPEFMFQNCWKLEGVELHDGITAVGRYAFDNCYELRSFTVTENITEIGQFAFSGCRRLWEVYNFSHLRIVAGEDGFGGIAANAVNIFYMKSDTSGVVTTGDGFVFCVARDVVYLVEYVGTESEVVLPEEYDGKAYTVHGYAFYDLDFVTSVTLPAGLVGIKTGAFTSCFALTDFIFGGTVDEWNAVSKSHGWNYGWTEYVVHCTDGDIS